MPPHGIPPQPSVRRELITGRSVKSGAWAWRRSAAAGSGSARRGRAQVRPSRKHVRGKGLPVKSAHPIQMEVGGLRLYTTQSELSAEHPAHHPQANPHARRLLPPPHAAPPRAAACSATTLACSHSVGATQPVV